MAEQTRRYLVHKHFYMFVDQCESLEKLRVELGEKNVSPILRQIIDEFLSKNKDSQLKIMKRGIEAKS